MEDCDYPVPTIVPVSPWLEHSGGLHEPEQRQPIDITFATPVHGITMVSQGALKCSGASIGRMIGYRNGTQIVTANNSLIAPADCGSDDVTFGVKGAFPPNTVIDRLVIEGVDPWLFPVFGLEGRALLDYTVTFDPTVLIECANVIRGQQTTCQIPVAVDAVTGWQFVGPVFFGLNDSVRITTTSTATAWTGAAVVSGTVSAFVTIGGVSDTLQGSLAVAGRTDAAWRWDNGSKWTFRQDGPVLCGYAPFVTPGSTLLGVNRRTSTCVPSDQSSIEPSVIQLASADSGFTADSVRGGPNDGLWYVTAAHYYMDRTSEMNPFIRPGAPADTLTNANDKKACRPPLHLGKNDPVVVNFHTYNTVCRSFSLTAFFNGILSHEGLGTLNPLDPASANGHEARRRIAARDSTNDPYRIVEPIVHTSRDAVRSVLRLDVDAADQRIRASADNGHAFVKNNYVVQGICGKAWVFHTTTAAYAHILVQQTAAGGAIVCI